LYQLNESTHNSIQANCNVLKFIESTENEELTITPLNKGFYLVKVQNGEKYAIYKVILF